MERLRLEAVGAVTHVESAYYSRYPAPTIKIEIRALTLVGETPSPLRSITLNAVISREDAFSAFHAGRVRMVFEFYDDDEADSK